MIQQVKEFAVKPDDLFLIHETHMKKKTSNTNNLSSDLHI